MYFIKFLLDSSNYLDKLRRIYVQIKKYYETTFQNDNYNFY